MPLTRSRHYHKQDNVHIERKNYAQVRLWVDYERYDNPKVAPLINAQCQGPLDQLLICFLQSLKLKTRERVGSWRK